MLKEIEDYCLGIFLANWDMIGRRAQIPLKKWPAALKLSIFDRQNPEYFTSGPIVIQWLIETS
jgi:hypothetical protein